MSSTTQMRAAVVAAQSFRPKGSGISVTRYELRLYGGPLGPSPYRRRRRDRTNPITLTWTTSGSGIPKWLCRLASAINRAEPRTQEEAEVLLRALTEDAVR